MAEKDILSQEEIDALLESVDEPAEADAAGEPAAKKKTAKKKAAKEEPQITESAFETSDTISEDGVRNVNFTGQERIVKGRLPVLDKIYDRAVRAFAADLYQLTAKDFEIKQDHLLIVKHRDFMEGLANPTLMSLVKLRPLRGKGLIVFDSTFVYDLVDYYFGGTTQFFAQTDKADFTATEIRVMDAVTKKLIGDLILAWAPIIQLEIIKFGEETNPQLMTIAEPEEMLLVARFHLNFGKETGSFYFVLPYSMVEPIKQQLELGASRPDDEIDPNWIKSLKEELLDVKLTLSASMAETKSSLGQVMSWQINDFVPLVMSEIVTLDIEGTPSFTGTLGTTNDKRALKIINKISY